ncbi:MAG: nucleotide exchange factor GrpE [Candidatus Micrarchaeota archaeon]|nr:nucleotide exchange factor GrpE [Candidatus Micrarchaeota archaeon]
MEKHDEAAPPQDEAEKKAGEAKETDAEARLAGLSEKLLRLQADFDNYQKRVAKEREQISKDAEARMMLRLIPLYEEIELAEKEVQKIADKSVKEGVLLVLSKLRTAFEKEGLEKMNVGGEKFDPFLHEAGAHVPSSKPAGTIIEVIKNGYFFKGEVLRHAVVVVSSGKKEEKEKPKEKEGEG